MQGYTHRVIHTCHREYNAHTLLLVSILAIFPSILLQAGWEFPSGTSSPQQTLGNK